MPPRRVGGQPLHPIYALIRECTRWSREGAAKTAVGANEDAVPALTVMRQQQLYRGLDVALQTLGTLAIVTALAGAPATAWTNARSVMTC